MKEKITLLITAVLVLLILMGCTNQKKIKSEVLVASKNWISNFNQGNIKEIVNAYTEDAVMEAKPFGIFNGRLDIEEFWSPFMKSGATDLKYTNTKVQVVSSRKAILSSDWSMNVGKGIITNETWIKINGNWKLKEDYFEVKEQLINNDNMNTQQETYVLVHAAWLGAWQWEKVSKKLIENGQNVVAPNLPGHGNDKTSPSEIKMDHYVNTIIDILDQQQDPVILVGHSFNGITISRVAELRPNKVKKLVYLTAFLLPNGGSFFKAVQGVEGSKAVENFYLSEDKTYALVKSEEIQNAFAHDIPKEAFDQAKPYIVPEPSAPLMYELEITDQNFGQIPKYYIECTDDRAIPIEVQRAMYKGKVKKTFTLRSSHTPNFSQPDKLAQILLAIKKEK